MKRREEREKPALGSLGVANRRRRWVGSGGVGEACLTVGGRRAMVAGKLPHCFVHRI